MIYKIHVCFEFFQVEEDLKYKYSTLQANFISHQMPNRMHNFLRQHGNRLFAYESFHLRPVWLFHFIQYKTKALFRSLGTRLNKDRNINIGIISTAY